MIDIKNINISFDDFGVIKDSELSFNKGQIIILIGESGSGKTTLLNLIGLKTNYPNIEYFINSKSIDFTNKEEIISYKKSLFSIVGQDNEVFPNMSVSQNIRFYQNMLEGTLENEKINSLLEKLELKDLLNKYPSKLSSGQLSRLSILLALIKNTDVLLLDEPTSSLDKETKSILMDVLKLEVKDNNKVVVIATNDDEIVDYADSLYEITDEKLCKKKQREPLLSDHFDLKQPKKLKSWRYSKHKSQSLKIATLLMLVVGITISSFTGILLSKTFKTINRSQAMLDVQTENQIIVFNESWEVGSWYSLTGSPFNQTELEAITNLDNILSIYPYYGFSGITGHSIGRWANMSDEQWRDKKVNIYQNEILQASYSIHYFEDYEYFTYIAPEHKEMSLDKKAIQIDSSVEEGVYMTESYAKLYGIECNENYEIEITVHIPAFLQDEIATNSKGISSAVKQVWSDPVVFRLKIKGIIPDMYSFADETNIFYPLYLDYNVMDRILKAKMEEFEDYYWEGATIHPYEVFTMILYVEDISQYDETVEELYNINENYAIYTPLEGFMYIHRLEIENAKDAMSTPLIALVLNLLFMLAFLILSTNLKKKEVQLLDVNGYSLKDIRKIFIVDFSIFILIITILSILICTMMNEMSHLIFIITVGSYLIVYVICVLFLCFKINHWINYGYYNK